MAYPNIYILGCGNVGLGLALALRAAGRRVLGMWNRGSTRREQAARLLNQSIDGPDLGASLSDADVILIAVADAAIGDVATRLVQSGRAPAGAVVAHLSGCLPAAALGTMPGIAQGSMHPVAACPSPERGPDVLRRATFALEGDAAAVARLEGVVGALGGKSIRISAATKARYHAAAVMASNLMVSLLSVASREGEAAGFTEAKRSYLALALGALEEVGRLGERDALTGPVARGDNATVERHLEALSPEAREIYRLLSLQALEIARTRDTVDSDTLSTLSGLLQK